MLDLLAIGDPVIDTHVQLDESSVDCYVDEINPTKLCLSYGEKIPIVDSFQSLGGNAPNVAVAAATLGLSSALIATIGRDVHGEMAIAELRRHGVNVDMVSHDDKHPTRYSIILNYRAERTVLSYSTEKNYQWPDHVPSAAYVYYTGLSKGFEVLQDHLVEYLATHQTTELVINPGSYIMKYAKEKLLELLPRTDILIVNKEEAEALSGTTWQREKSYTALMHKLLAYGVREVVLTDGKKGSWVATMDEVWHQSAFPIDVVAKTGAGDAFSAAYLAARRSGHAPSEAIRWGTANSTAVIAEHGPHRGLLSRSTLEQSLTRFKDIKPEAVVE